MAPTLRLTVAIMSTMALSSYAAAAAPTTAVTVTVVDEQGRPMPGVDVAVGYPEAAGTRDRIVRVTTDTRGQVQATGETYRAVAILVTKPGYYESRAEVPVYDVKDAQRVYRDQAVTIGLRPIKHPIPMHARFQYGAEIPVLGTPVGFDLLEGDWVAPHGKGRTADFLFTVRASGTSEYDYDAALTLSFPNEGDGLIPFDPHPASDLVSPYTAPETGYQAQKSWRRSRRPTGGPPPGPSGAPATTILDETSPYAHYVFRVRTIRNADGTIRSALYGKLYGDPQFFPPLPQRFGAGVRLTYYLNPTPNDRNLEADWQRNLATGLKSYQKPKRP